MTSSQGIMAGRRRLGGKGIRGDLGGGTGEAGDQLALAGVGSAQQDGRAGALPGDSQAVALLFGRPLFGRLFPA